MPLYVGSAGTKNSLSVFPFNPTDKNVIRYTRRHPHTQAVNFTALAITDQTCKILAKNCDALQKLVLINCVNISDAGIAALDKCTSLTKIDIRGCVKITKAGLEAFKIMHPLTKIRISKEQREAFGKAFENAIPNFYPKEEFKLPSL